jgi:hypothetical protein
VRLNIRNVFRDGLHITEGVSDQNNLFYELINGQFVHRERVQNWFILYFLYLFF